MTPTELEALETDLRERAKSYGEYLGDIQRLKKDLANVVAHLRAVTHGDLNPTKVRHAAVSMIERSDGKLLCVWNRRYNGWSLPGGMVEEGETVFAAQSRELAEETGLTTLKAALVFQGEHGIKTDASRASVVHVFRVEADGLAREMEDGCPVTWLSRQEFVMQSPFGTFYAKVFVIDAAIAHVDAQTMNDVNKTIDILGDAVRAYQNFEGNCRRRDSI